jgi:hypothetical protein
MRKSNLEYLLEEKYYVAKYLQVNMLEMDFWKKKTNLQIGLTIISVFQKRFIQIQSGKRIVLTRSFFD